MDVNGALLQIPSPASASSSEGPGARFQTGKNPGLGGTKKSFGSVLHTVHQGERKERPQQSDDAESRRVSKPETKPDQGKSVRDDTPSSGEINGRGHDRDAETDRLSQSQTDQSDDKEGRSQDEGVRETNTPAELERVLDQVVLPQGAPMAPSVLATEDSRQGNIEDALPPTSQNNGIGEMSVAPVLLTAEPEGSVTATTEETDKALPLPQGETVPMGKQSQTTFAVQPAQDTHEAPSGQPLDPMAEPVIKAVDQKTGKQGGAPTQGDHLEGQTTSVQPATDGGKQASYVPQELSGLDAAGPQLDRVVERSLGHKQVEGVVQSHAEPRPRFSSRDGEGRIEKQVAMAPYTPQAFSGSGRPADVLWSNQDDLQPASHETPWPPHPLSVSSQSDPPDDHSAQPATVGNAVASQSRPVDSRPPSPAGPAAFASPAHEVEPLVSTMSRSVVFEVAEPDLGRIHIRVAMTNELVHAHLSSDRSDVGQFLFNGQDRLQSALQSNGLEMGQFRVDIDRQSAGRSFQQGPPQDQSRMWQQGSNEASRETGLFERHESVGLSYAGRLNVVA